MSSLMECVGATREIQTHTLGMTGHSQCGFLFDVTARLEDIAVRAVTFVPGVKDGDYDIWTAQESHESVHQNAKAWTLVAKGAHSGIRGCKFRVPFHRHVHIRRRARHAFYISGHNVNGVCFSTESKNTCSAENEDLTIHLGHFKAFPWEGVLSTGPFGHNGMQAFVGTLEYEVIQSRAADHVVQTTGRLWESRPFPDADLVAAGGRTFCVHRCVLAAASAQLEEAWRDIPAIAGERPKLQVDAPEETVEALLHFIYTGSDDGGAAPGDVLRLAHLFTLPRLVRSSAARLASALTRESAVASVRALRPYRDHPGCEVAWRAMLVNVQELVAQDSGLLEEICMSV